ncbi:MAG TPA: winged helix-turn-helix domain-containing protein [Rugosimonospora sp.]|nr:winged helix-turn-helix domain-containing protein [Rugosimonospora sp.]
MSDTATAADRIAGDLALAIHQGLLAPGEQVPSQTKLMRSYGVAMATASSALSKLATAGLTRAEPGRGTFVADHRRSLNPNIVLEVMAAASVCRTLAATVVPAGRRASVGVGGHPDWNSSSADPDKVWPPRRVDVAALNALDRHLLRWMSEALLLAARRLVSAGRTDSDTHLVEAARAILRDGARRPSGQPPIAEHGGPVPPGEDVALRIWPERSAPADPAGPPF